MLGFSPLVAGPLAALPVAEAGGTADAYVTAPLGGVVLGTDGSTFIAGSAGTTTAEASASIAVTATASAGIIRPAAATAATAVTASASADRYRTVDPAAPGAPILNYYCANHSAMGGATNHSAASTTNYVVTVAYASGGNKYYLNGVQQPLISLAPGATYTFHQSDSSNSNHPLRLSTTPGGTHFGGSTYSTNVSYVGTPGQAGSYTQIVVPAAIQVAGTAVSSLIQFPILADVNLVTTASTPTAIRFRVTTAIAATTVTATAIAIAIRGGVISAATAVTANNTIMPAPLNYASKDVLSGAIPTANRTASIASASVGPAAIKYVSAAANMSMSATSTYSRVRLVNAAAAIVVSGTAEIGGSLEAASATANIAITASGGDLLKVKPTSAATAVSATSAGAASRVRQVSATADISVTGTADRMAYIGMADAAQISVVSGVAPVGAIKIASATAATAITANATPQRVRPTTAAASLSATATNGAIRLRLVDAAATTAATATATAFRACAGAAQIAGAATVTGAANMLYSGSANITAAASTSAIGGTNVDSSATLSASASMSATGSYLWNQVSAVSDADIWAPQSGGNVETPEEIWQTAA